MNPFELDCYLNSFNFLMSSFLIWKLDEVSPYFALSSARIAVVKGERNDLEKSESGKSKQGQACSELALVYYLT